MKKFIGLVGLMFVSGCAYFNKGEIKEAKQELKTCVDNSTYFQEQYERIKLKYEILLKLVNSKLAE